MRNLPISFCRGVFSRLRFVIAHAQIDGKSVRLYTTSQKYRYSQIMSRPLVGTSSVTSWLVLVLVGRVSCVQDQAPGDGVDICTEEIVGGMLNPFFANRPVYSANERPLMDSRDYNRLLQASGEAYVPWQSLDRDNNNTNMAVTQVRTILIIYNIIMNYSPVDSNCNSHMCWDSDSVWIL